MIYMAIAKRDKARLIPAGAYAFLEVKG